MLSLRVEPRRAEPVSEQATVFVVDHAPEACQTVGTLAASVGLNIESCASAREFLEKYDPQRPGCLVAEVILPGMTGLALQERLAAIDVSLPIIFTTAHAEVSTATRAMRAGAFDFFDKPFSQHSLLESIQQAIDVDRRRRRELAVRRELAARVAKLTNRQRQVMRLLAKGVSTKAIASQLELSPKTVDNHRASVMEKMGAGNVAQLVRLMVRAEFAAAEFAT
jgi:FixJ family two-component response regulator